MDDTFELQTERCGRLLVVTPLANEITFKNTKPFLQSVKCMLSDDCRDVVLNLRNVEIIDSVSLGALVAILKYAKSLGGDMAISNVSPPIGELFDLLNFQSVFRTFDTVDEAVDCF